MSKDSSSKPSTSSIASPVALAPPEARKEDVARFTRLCKRFTTDQSWLPRAEVITELHELWGAVNGHVGRGQARGKAGGGKSKTDILTFFAYAAKFLQCSEKKVRRYVEVCSKLGPDVRRAIYANPFGLSNEYSLLLRIANLPGDQRRVEVIQAAAEGLDCAKRLLNEIAPIAGPKATLRDAINSREVILSGNQSKTVLVKGTLVRLQLVRIEGGEVVLTVSEVATDAEPAASGIVDPEHNQGDGDALSNEGSNGAVIESVPEDGPALGGAALPPPADARPVADELLTAEPGIAGEGTSQGAGGPLTAGSDGGSCLESMILEPQARNSFVESTSLDTDPTTPKDGDLEVRPPATDDTDSRADGGPSGMEEDVSTDVPQLVAASTIEQADGIVPSNSEENPAQELTSNAESSADAIEPPPSDQPDHWLDKAVTVSLTTKIRGVGKHGADVVRLKSAEGADPTREEVYGELANYVQRVAGKTIATLKSHAEKFGLRSPGGKLTPGATVLIAYCDTTGEARLFGTGIVTADGTMPSELVFAPRDLDSRVVTFRAPKDAKCLGKPILTLVHEPSAAREVAVAAE